MRWSCKKFIKPMVFLNLRAFSKSGDKKKQQEFLVKWHYIKQHLIGYLHNNLFIMLELSKAAFDCIIKVPVLIAFTITLYILSINSVDSVDFSIIDLN